ncbi:MAG: hypothetical protein HKO53_12540 [Gemmatimonadetes bacterium]|nr:hypothetical protein [Gemmatimonadota bacterium]
MRTFLGAVAGKEPDPRRSRLRAPSQTRLSIGFHPYAFAGALALWVIGWTALPSSGQSTRLTTTLRYGSGALDVPFASVLPGGTLVLSYSGFGSSLGRVPLVDTEGDIVGFGPGRDRWYSDFALALGIADRIEVGASFQDPGGGGDPWAIGGFGRIALLRPERTGIGLAAGARWVAVGGGDGSAAVGRLGFIDPRLPRRNGGTVAGEFDGGLSPYVVATGTFRGPAANLFPAYDLTVSLGVGGGLFSEGAGLEFYGPGHSSGWFAASTLHVGLGEGRALSVLGEYNGFDANGGLEVDLGGLRVGAALLGLNHGNGGSVYRSRKLGLTASLSLCPLAGLGCLRGGGLLERPRRDVVVLPAPPPDTVRVEVPVPTPEPFGRQVDLCLSTGRGVTVRITQGGDTLVAPRWVSMRRSEGTLGLAGAYWETREPARPMPQEVQVDGVSYEVESQDTRPDCQALRPWQWVLGLPAFVPRSGETEPEGFYLPVRPGVWRWFRRSGR